MQAGYVSTHVTVLQYLTGVPASAESPADISGICNYLDSQHRISCFYFPPYAPELNPVEYVWSYLKSSPLSNFAPKNFDELSEKSKSAFHHLKYKHRLLTSLVKHSPIPFFD